jgi:hypothetical protein
MRIVSAGKELSISTGMLQSVRVIGAV